MRSPFRFGISVKQAAKNRSRLWLSILFLALLLPCALSITNGRTTQKLSLSTTILQQAASTPPVWLSNPNLTASLKTTTGLLLTWTNATGALYYNITSSTDVIATVSCGPDTDPLYCQSYYVTGLTPNTPYTFQVIAGDTIGWTPGPTLSVTTAKAPVSNNPPAISVPGPQPVPVSNVLTFTVNASDPDPLPEQVTLIATGLPTGASFPTATGNPASNTFSWTPSSSQGPANYTVTFQASDGVSTVSKSVLIEVLKGLRSPTITVPTTQTVSPGTILSFAVIALDPNNPPLPVTLGAAGLPGGSGFDNRTGLFIWTPTTSQAPGVYNLVFTATNARGSTTSKLEIDVVGSTAVTASLQLLTLDYGSYLAIALILTSAFVGTILYLRKRSASNHPSVKVTNPIGNGKGTGGQEK